MLRLAVFNVASGVAEEKSGGGRRSDSRVGDLLIIFTSCEGGVVFSGNFVGLLVLFVRVARDLEVLIRNENTDSGVIGIINGGGVL